MENLKAAAERQPKLRRWLCHIYQRRKQGRLNLVTGAGISVEAGVPKLGELLDRLASNSGNLKSDLEHHKNAGLNPEYLGQIIFHRQKNDFNTDVEPALRDVMISYKWAESIHHAIYKDVPKNIEHVFEKHSYLRELVRLARKLPLVINFNFDDILSDAMGNQVECAAEDGNGSFTVTWQPSLVERPATTTIYHVNGILPRVSLRKRSPQLIFTEDSFSDALARSPGVSAEYIFLRFVQNTMLMIGNSLGDSSLKIYLRKNRDRMPANHHYVVNWLGDEGGISNGQMNDVFEANLELYNAITLFLTSNEIAAVLRLLNYEEREFTDKISDVGTDEFSQYFYYIAGPVAAGKSSLLEHLRSFNTFEEWTRPAPKEMYLSVDKLTPEEATVVDDFVYSEIEEKNRRFSESGVGFHFMDRAPLDLYAFSKTDDERKEKTAKIMDLIARSKRLQPGEIVFVTASGGELVKRNLGRGRLPNKSGEETYLVSQLNFLKEIYKPQCIYSTDDQSAGMLAKKVARRALLGDYSPVDFESTIKRFS